MASKKKDTVSYCPPSKPSRIGSVLSDKIGEKSIKTAPVTMRAPYSHMRKQAPDLIADEVGFPSSKGITTAEKCSAVEKGKPLALKDCDLSLQFVSDATSYGTSRTTGWGVKPGAYLRMCTKWGEEPLLIPVKNHEDAMQKGRKICACVREGKSDKKSCFRKSNRGDAKQVKFSKRTKSEPHAPCKNWSADGLRCKPGKSEAGKSECLQWSKSGKRCLRRAKV